MPDAKLSITVGSITFTGEGEEGWLATQLDKVLEKAPSLATARTPRGSATVDEEPQNDAEAPGTLAGFLTAAKAGSNQVTRFLATAEWLHRKGAERLKTAEVSKALQDNHQRRLGNPADSLAKNIAKGHCEKVGKEFFVTDDGRKSLGI